MFKLVWSVPHSNTLNRGKSHAEGEQSLRGNNRCGSAITGKKCDHRGRGD
jgi:hypothetical protein